MTALAPCQTCGGGGYPRFRSAHADWCERVRTVLRGPNHGTLNVATHGTLYGYWQGCRCEPCRAEMSAYGRARRKAADEAAA